MYRRASLCVKHATTPSHHKPATHAGRESYDSRHHAPSRGLLNLQDDLLHLALAQGEAHVGLSVSVLGAQHIRRTRAVAGRARGFERFVIEVELDRIAAGRPE